jgi:hypothetical protein
MRDVAIVRLAVRAGLDGSDEALRDAREAAARGDTDHAWLLQGRTTGTLLLAELLLTAYAEAADGRLEEASVVNHGVWLERDSVPHVEAQVAEAATKDFARLAAALRERSLSAGPEAFDHMHVHVELEGPLRQALSTRAARDVSGTRPDSSHFRSGAGGYPASRSSDRRSPRWPARRHETS